MKFRGEFLTLSVFQSVVWRIKGFVVQPPKTIMPSALRSSSDEIVQRSSPDAGSQPVKSSAPNATPGRADKSLAGIWNTASSERVQGNTLRTWPVDPSLDRMLVSLKTAGRPLNANLELWNGPDYTPSKLGIYIEDGDLRPFSTVMATPLDSNTIALYNTGSMEFPITACVAGDNMEGPGGLEAVTKNLDAIGHPKLLQGGSVHTIPFDPSVASIQISLKTDGRNLKARIELLQGPNNNKQVVEYYTSDGYKRPFFAVIETPGEGNVVRIVNENTVEYPFTACVEPFMMDPIDD